MNPETTHSTAIRELSFQGQVRLSPLVYVVVGATAAAAVAWIRPGGINVRAWGWLVPFGMSLLMLARDSSRITFPFTLWLPWACYVMLYVPLAQYPHVLQRSVMLLCPILVGMAVSTTSVREAHLKTFFSLCCSLGVALFLVVALSTGLYLSRLHPMITGFAGQAMTVALLCSYFAAHYAAGRKNALAWWGALATIPVMGILRGATLATIVTLPSTLVPQRPTKRIAMLLLIGLVGSAIFYLPEVQQKMFQSGRGSFRDIRPDNPDFRTSGRLYTWGLMLREIKKKPWLGHGANAQEQFLYTRFGFYGQPHNDWLRLLFDYGVIGTLIFAGCLISQVVHAWRMARRTTGETSVLFYAAASSFLPFVLLMITDNIILYAAFFGNLQFTMLGLAYATAAATRSTLP